MSGIEEWFEKLVEEGKIPQTPMNYDTASYQIYVAHLEAENVELTKKARQLDEQLKAISDRTTKFPSLEQIEKRFLDWAIPFLKARITGCKEEWFGIDYIAKAIWEFIKDGFENAIAVDETNAALCERLDKAVILPYRIGDKFYEVDYYPPEITEKECCDFSFREFPKILLEDGCGCTYELGDNGFSFITLNKSEAEQIYNKKIKEQHND